jgi:hypothetical protein
METNIANLDTENRMKCLSYLLGCTLASVVDHLLRSMSICSWSASELTDARFNKMGLRQPMPSRRYYLHCEGI